MDMDMDMDIVDMDMDMDMPLFLQVFAHSVSRRLTAASAT